MLVITCLSKAAWCVFESLAVVLVIYLMLTRFVSNILIRSLIKWIAIPITFLQVVGILDIVIYKEWKTKDIAFVGDFADRDYGSKDFRIKDNNGNMLIVGHALGNKEELIQKGNVA